MIKEYLVRFGSNSVPEIIKLDEKGYQEALDMGYQIIPLED